MYSMPFLTVEEIIKKSDAGMTQPYLCELSDGDHYYVKGRSATVKGCISESICAQLGREFGLPIPDFAIVDIDIELTKYDKQAAFDLGSGLAFASKAEENITEVKISDLEKFQDEILRKIFLFDTWIKNEDRTGTSYGGNPNLFFKVTTEEIIVIDHNLAFDRNFNIDSQNDLHICKEYWFSNPQDVLLRSIFEPQMANAIDKLGDQIRNLPKEWIENEPEHLHFIETTLRRYDSAKFWEQITWAV